MGCEARVFELLDMEVRDGTREMVDLKARKMPQLRGTPRYFVHVPFLSGTNWTGANERQVGNVLNPPFHSWPQDATVRSCTWRAGAFGLASRPNVYQLLSTSAPPPFADDLLPYH